MDRLYLRQINELHKIHKAIENGSSDNGGGDDEINNNILIIPGTLESDIFTPNVDSPSYDEAKEAFFSGKRVLIQYPGGEGPNGLVSDSLMCIYTFEGVGSFFESGEYKLWYEN